jgi:dihydrofolate reductase
MSRLVLHMGMSLDGYVASDREHPGVAVPEGDELVSWKLDRITKAGAHLMGRMTYQEMAGHWPHSTHPYATPMNDIPKVVFSKTLSEASWPVSRIARGEMAAEIAALKEEAGPDVIAWGGTTPGNRVRGTRSTPTTGRLSSRGGTSGSARGRRGVATSGCDGHVCLRRTGRTDTP